MDADVAREAAGAFGRHPSRGYEDDRLFDLIGEAEWDAYYRAHDAIYDAHVCDCDGCRDRHLTELGKEKIKAVASLLPESYLIWLRDTRDFRLRNLG